MHQSSPDSGCLKLAIRRAAQAHVWVGKDCIRLPSPSTIALRLITLAQDPQVSLSQVGELVQCDPALTGKLLRLANSPLYGYGGTVTTLSRALQVLGLNATVILALSFSLRDELGSASAASFNTARYWCQSLFTALAARGLAVELRETLPESFFLAGLLREIGLLAMDAAFGARWVRIYQRSDDHSDLLARETEALGFNHAEAGAWLLRQWRLPEYLPISVTNSHGAPPFAAAPTNETARVSACVAVASRMADAWLAGGDSDALAGIGETIAPGLPLKSDQYWHMLAELTAQIPWIETCFEVQLMDAAQRRAMEDRAQDIAIARNLLSVRAADDLEQRTRALERRTDGLDARAQRDSMTGLFNREYIVATLDKAFANANRDDTPLSVAFIDIDRFKAINDTYGHAAGDSVIIGVARRLLVGVRQTDVVARYGGEEFVIILSAVAPEEGHAIMQRLLSNIRLHSFRLPDNSHLNVTVSIGVATHRSESSIFPDARQLLESADQAMYVAKRSGRNRVVANGGVAAERRG
ncbi:GGDEF domain-containing protein [Salinisphaera sp.]|uniref:GGDEF domain-containing protein n=1 Tax=Salinisphaera sp. TaxID=1914330 RepID=UPI002D7765DC|nr:GGDEF domain-containing protein [Salinisphaera sp.]HET7314429.1 GGDEF domain-containing protein [Salinisphaera sp.]